jgi:hypothetical protein
MAERLAEIARDFLHVPNDGMIEDHNHLQSAAALIRALVAERDALSAHLSRAGALATLLRAALQRGPGDLYWDRVALALADYDENINAALKAPSHD